MAADIAFLILDRPIQNAVEGKHYVKVWDEEEGSIVGREFTLAGWGASGELLDTGSENHLDRNMEVFHRGYNVVDSITDNMLNYSMQSPDNGGLELESMGHNGDSGSGAFIIDGNGDHRLVGVKSNGQDAFWGSEHQYTYASGFHLTWIEDNLASPNA